jgi:hypothetical protein
MIDGSHSAVSERAVEIAELESIESPRHDGGIEWDRVLRLDDEQDKVFEQSMSETRGISPDTSSSIQHCDSGHLAGTSRSAFEARQGKGQEERQEPKSQQERTEEEIVLDYIKKQSLVEEQLRSKGKSRAVASAEDEEEDQDLRRALDLSMQGIDCVYEMDG